MLGVYTLPMPRPALGPQAKTEVASVRLTKAEAQALRERYGTTTMALRVLIASATVKKQEDR